MERREKEAGDENTDFLCAYAMEYPQPHAKNHAGVSYEADEPEPATPRAKVKEQMIT